MKLITKYLSISAVAIFLMSTLSSCWIAVPSTVQVKHVHTKKDNGLHKGWHKHPNHKKHHKHNHKHGHGHRDFAPTGEMCDHGSFDQTIELRLDQPE